MLFLHQLTWQLEAMQALMHVLTAKQTAQQFSRGSSTMPDAEGEGHPSECIVDSLLLLLCSTEQLPQHHMRMIESRAVNLL